MIVEDEARVLEYLRRIADATEALVVLLTNGPDGGVEQVHIGDHTPDSDPDYLAAVAAEVEGRIQDGATPRVSRSVDIGDTEAFDAEAAGLRINLFEQPRDTIGSLKDRAPKDIYLSEVNEQTPPEIIAAIEIVYTNLPIDLWGTDHAKAQITQLVAMHEGAA
jgi:hypothetical protein